MQRAIVTGAEGFLGRHLVGDLRKHGVHVTALGRQSRREASYIGMGDAPWCVSRLSQIIESAEPDVVFHLVGGAAGSPADILQLNVGVAEAVMQALRAVQARPLLVCCGSAAEYGRAVIDGEPVAETARCAPTSVYGAAKLAQTKAALAFAEATATPVLIARIFNPIGPGMPPYLALGGFARQISLLPPCSGVLQTGNLHVFRDFIDVDGVVGALRSLAHNPNARGVVNICSGQAIELGTLVDLLIDVSGKDVMIETVASRLRQGELKVIVGSTAHLARLGAAPPPTDYAGVVSRVWRDAAGRQAAAS